MADPAVKLTKAQAWVLRERMREFGWHPRWWVASNTRDAAALAALLNKGAVESDGEGQVGEMVRTTDKGRALLDALKDEGEAA